MLIPWGKLIARLLLTPVIVFPVYFFFGIPAYALLGGVIHGCWGVHTIQRMTYGALIPKVKRKVFFVLFLIGVVVHFIFSLLFLLYFLWSFR